MASNILIVTYYWPPAGGPGVQRWLSMAKYLALFDKKVTILIPDNPNYPIIDESLVNEIPTNLTILKQPIVEPYQIARLFSKKKTKHISSGLIPEKASQSFLDKVLLWIRGNVFIPDARVLWVKPCVKRINHLLQQQSFDTLITTGPPHSLHLIGLKLKQQHPSLQWVADFRDPWTTIGYQQSLYLSQWSQQKHQKLEQAVLNTADKIVVTSNVTKQAFSQLTPKPIKVITNGFDDQQDTSALRGKFKTQKFSMAHLGSWLTHRNPEILWECLEELILENPDFKQNFELRVAGRVSEQILEKIEHYSLSKHLINYGYLSHNETLVLQKETSVLLLIETNSPETKCIIPGKLFEYLISNRPIIAIGPADSDVESIIKTTNTGNYFYYHQKEALKNKILSAFQSHQNNTLSVQAIGIQAYHRKVLTQLFINFLDT